ncbi:MAG: 50S ribosomal protein L19 [Oligoflexales bacterium]|nr:50S ribosomal protein L19 [Oligoflexales bacterium]
MKNEILARFEQRILSKTKKHPSFRPGDRVRLHYKIEEATKSDKGEAKFRLQVFEGVCLRFRKGLTDATFTLRKIGANAVGVERIFALCSPFIDKIELISGGRVRRSRLYYLRNLSGKAARIRSRRLVVQDTVSEQAAGAAEA